MSVTTSSSLTTFADLIDLLGVAPERIRLQPAPGTATEQDVIALSEQSIYCELIDGVLVEKAMGQHESELAMWLGHFLLNWIEQGNDVGVVHGPDAPHRLFAGQVRYPDVAFVRYDRLPGGKRSRDSIASWAPNLSVEIISSSNTPTEMSSKLLIYFESGVELVWFVDPRLQTIDVYTAPESRTTLHRGDVLDGGTVLPGFELSVGQLFDKVG